MKEKEEGEGKGERGEKEEGKSGITSRYVGGMTALQG